MSVFDTAAATLFADANFGQAATYTPVSGSPRAVTVILYKDQAQPQPFSEMAEVRDLADIRKSELGVSPRQGDTIAIAGGATYRVDRWPLPSGEGDDGYVYKMRVRKI
jgi:hypothetical protein